ncbi:hypothetical protein KM043_010869 [Ampulex compressa]|nr:hypothetical protein KM043_010869 [Ampulex compressa]
MEALRNIRYREEHFAGELRPVPFHLPRKIRFTSAVKLRRPRNRNLAPNVEPSRRSPGQYRMYPENRYVSAGHHPVVRCIANPGIRCIDSQSGKLISTPDEWPIESTSKCEKMEPVASS